MPKQGSFIFHFSRRRADAPADDQIYNLSLTRTIWSSSTAQHHLLAGWLARPAGFQSTGRVNAVRFARDFP